MDTPLISIIIVTYNREKYITEAISSVQKQSYRNWELLVVDDASTDKTEDVVMDMADKDSRIRYVRQKENVGIARNRNTGLAEAKGAYIAMLDSDDFWIDSEKLKVQLDFLEAHPDHALVGTWMTLIDADSAPAGSAKYEIHDADIRKEILLRNQFAQSSILCRTSAIRDAGGYDASVIVLEDYRLWLQIGLAHKFANIPEYMTGYRVHTGSITTGRRLLTADEHIRAIRKFKYGYPRYATALIKGYARMLLALIGV